MQKTLELQNGLSPLLSDKKIAWLLISISAILMSIDNFLKMPFLVGGWHIVMYLLLLTPLVYLLIKGEIKNRYTKWFMPFLFIMIVDMFYYNNDLVQYALPVIFYIFVGLLYVTSMHHVNNLYQTILPKFKLQFSTSNHIKTFILNLVLYKTDKSFLKRIIIALFITLPFFAVFTALLVSSDSHYKDILLNLFSFDANFNLKYFITVPLYFLLYLQLFIYGFSNQISRVETKETQKFDLLIIGIFLGLINFLFATFVVMQIPFLISSNYALADVNIATFAREGFFQLVAVLVIVSAIFLFILRRYKQENSIKYLLIGLLAQSIMMGIVSLKKMYLYQAIKGATVLRYYVEWFDYFLIVVLFFGILFLIKNKSFTKLLNLITILAIVSFTIIVSINIDAMVAKHNIEKFKNTPQKLDKKALSELSIDVLPVLKKNDIHVTAQKNRHRNRYRNCHSFSEYHFGYCTIKKEYGAWYE